MAMSGIWAICFDVFGTLVEPRLAVKKGDRLPGLCFSLRAPLMPLRRATGWAELDGSVEGERTPAALKRSRSVRRMVTR